MTEASAHEAFETGGSFDAIRTTGHEPDSIPAEGPPTREATDLSDRLRALEAFSAA